MAFDLNALVQKTLGKFTFRGIDIGVHGHPIITNAINDAYEAGKAAGSQRDSHLYVRKTDMAAFIQAKKEKVYDIDRALGNLSEDLSELYEDLDEKYDDLSD